MGCGLLFSSYRSISVSLLASRNIILVKTPDWLNLSRLLFNASWAVPSLASMVSTSCLLDSATSFDSTTDSTNSGGKFSMT